MTVPRLCALVTVVLIILSGCACHAQKITVDPYSVQAAKPVEDEALDARLMQKVTYEAWHKPVKVILADLSKSTGIILNAGASMDNWQVRDRKMNICVKDIPLAQLMTSIARVMKFKWTKNDDATPPTYRLRTDYRLLAEMQAESSKRENEMKREEMKRRTELLDALAKAADASGSQLSSLKQSNPYLYLCAESGFAKLVTQMFDEVPRMREMFIQGDKNLLPKMAVFSPETQQLFIDVMRKNDSLDKTCSSRERLPGDLEDMMQNNNAHLTVTPNPYETSIRQRLFDFGTISTHYVVTDYTLGWLKDPNAKSTQVWAKSCQAALDQKMDTKGFYTKFYGDINNSSKEDAKAIEYYLMLDPAAEHADEPELHKQVSPKISDEAQKAMMEEAEASEGRAVPRLEYQATLKALADAAEVNIISDSFAVVLAENIQLPGKAELADILKQVQDAYRCNWEKHGSVIELRRMDWFRRRSSQVPDEWIRPWRDELEKNGIPSLDSYARMVTLSDEQIEENINNDNLLGKVASVWWEYGNNQGLLRFYLQLTAKQREHLFSEEGFDPRTLSPIQRPYYNEMFHYGRRHTWNREEFTTPDANVKLIAHSELQPDESIIYWIKAYLTKEDGSVTEDTWAISLHRIAWPEDKVSQDK